jgi:hypothetical protein
LILVMSVEQRMTSVHNNLSLIGSFLDHPLDLLLIGLE